MMNDFWAGKRVLVTGIAGFLGSWLADELIRRDAEVVGLVRDDLPNSRFAEVGIGGRATIVHGDLADFFLLERILNEYEIDTCFHLAAQPIVTVANRLPMSTFESNIRGTWNLLEAARHYGKAARIVAASSDKAYGESALLPYREELPLASNHPYDVSKSCTDLLAQTYAASYGMPVTVSRCGNFYGGGDTNWSRIVPGTFRSIIRGERPMIRSDGTLLRDYFYIEDVVEAYLSLGQAADRADVRGRAFNFGTESPVSVRDLVATMLRVTGRADLEPIILGDAPNEINAQYLSSERARNTLGWSPRIPLEEGLRRSYDWYQKYLARSSKKEELIPSVILNSILAGHSGPAQLV
ncbi:sugar dehydratase [Candidatus Uhrbacteria bacterium RIFCSPHIGHO2_02_FULL_57_19]|uniref:Sugar dehydratase n=1 Tax=Candidatus Uhrbacteria bacterium RIFCSPHIGHO2_02_FULL_57_19 TaxID=1802391 RepID=A0A1F7U381_9BACT|nr:MAG: sugar dehydratase [Candidatus Uhrbacteria bacterium RIFCSPHIGHO2_02_FULL_57_19]